jgi:hypothetical protein
MKTKDVLRLVVCGLAVLALPTYSQQLQSAPTIVWQTTFDCPEWNQTMGLGDADVCEVGDGIAGWGSWMLRPSKPDSITAAANFPGGGGGRGFRSMRGDGVNQNGGALKITLPSLMTEVWVRWYMRYQAGFNWANGRPYYTKELYFNDMLTNAPVFVSGFSFGNFGVNKVFPQPSDNMNSGGTPGSWNNIMGGPVGDGKFHAYEVHVKMDTNGSNGIAETWIDGVQVHRRTNVNWGGTSPGWLKGWSFFTVAINQSEIANNGVDMYTDFDDFAVSSSGYIGPIGGGTPQPTGPAPPLNLRITQ